MVSFSEFCETQEIYAERGARGGKIRKKAETEAEEENKEDEYEFQEVM